MYYTYNNSNWQQPHWVGRLRQDARSNNSWSYLIKTFFRKSCRSKWALFDYVALHGKIFPVMDYFQISAVTILKLFGGCWWLTKLTYICATFHRSSQIRYINAMNTCALAGAAKLSPYIGQLHSKVPRATSREITS